MNGARITVINFRHEKPELGATLLILVIWWVPVQRLFSQNDYRKQQVCSFLTLLIYIPWTVFK